MRRTLKVIVYANFTHASSHDSIDFMPFTAELREAQYAIGLLTS